MKCNFCQLEPFNFKSSFVYRGKRDFLLNLKRQSSWSSSSFNVNATGKLPIGLSAIDNNWIEQKEIERVQFIYFTKFCLTRGNFTSRISPPDHMLWLDYSNEEDFTLPVGLLLTPRLDTLLKWLSMWVLLLLSAQSFNVELDGNLRVIADAIVPKFLYSRVYLIDFVYSTFSRRCARNANVTGCLDLVPSKHAGCACPTSASLAIRSKIASTVRREFKSATVCEVTTRTRLREATGETRTLRRTRTTWERQTRFTGDRKITRSRTGKSDRCRLNIFRFLTISVLSLLHRYKFSLKPYNPDHKPPTQKDLVYFEQSPGFCEKNLRLGILGTHGRQCNDTSIGVDGCDLMCCGRGYRTQEVTVVERCACTFHWCCEVKCKTCRTKKTIHTCL